MHAFLIWIDMSIIFQNLLNFSFALYAIIKTVLSFLTSICLQNADLHFYFLRLEKGYCYVGIFSTPYILAMLTDPILLLLFRPHHHTTNGRIIFGQKIFVKPNNYHSKFLRAWMIFFKVLVFVHWDSLCFITTKYCAALIKSPSILITCLHAIQLKKVLFIWYG